MVAEGPLLPGTGGVRQQGRGGDRAAGQQEIAHRGRQRAGGRAQPDPQSAAAVGGQGPARTVLPAESPRAHEQRIVNTTIVSVSKKFGTVLPYRGGEKHYIVGLWVEGLLLDVTPTVVPVTSKLVGLRRVFAGSTVHMSLTRQGGCLRRSSHIAPCLCAQQLAVISGQDLTSLLITGSATT